MTDEPKFELAWRTNEPVLDYQLRGFWTEPEATAWLIAISAAVRARPNPSAPWYMFGDLTELRTQSESVNDIRDRVTQMALENGLAGCVMFGVSGVRLLQLERLLKASGHADRFAYAETRDEGVQLLDGYLRRPA